MKFSIRDIIWLTAVVALSLCWYRERSESRILASEKAKTESELATAKTLGSVLFDVFRIHDYKESYSAPGTHLSGAYPRALQPKTPLLTGDDVLRVLLSKDDCVFLGEVVDDSGDYTAHEAGSHISSDRKVRIIDVAKGKGLPVGEQITLEVDMRSTHPWPKKGDQ
jgi:hypothetical protein